STKRCGRTGWSIKPMISTGEHTSHESYGSSWIFGPLLVSIVTNDAPALPGGTVHCRTRRAPRWPGIAPHAPASAQAGMALRSVADRRLIRSLYPVVHDSLSTRMRRPAQCSDTRFVADITLFESLHCGDGGYNGQMSWGGPGSSRPCSTAAAATQRIMSDGAGDG